MNGYQPDLTPLFEELACYLSASDVTALHDIVTEIQQRIERFQQGL